MVDLRACCSVCIIMFGCVGFADTVYGVLVLGWEKYDRDDWNMRDTPMDGCF